MTSPRRRWLTVLAVASLFLGLGWILDRGAGLTRVVLANGAEIASSRVDGFDLAGLSDTIAGRSSVKVIWRGTWDVPAADVYDLALGSRGHSSWSIDEHVAHEAGIENDSVTRRAVWLDAGFHGIEVAYESDAATPQLTVSVARSGEPLNPINSSSLKTRSPRNPRLRGTAVFLYHALGWALLGLAVFAMRQTISAGRTRWRDRLDDARARALLSRAGKALAWSALACIVIYGALLRIDAITARYGPVTSPAWLAAVQTRTIARPDAIRPSSYTWQPAPLYPHQDGTTTHYISDPYVYLKSAREMQSFYAAHFREPVYSFAVKVVLYFLNQQDVAVSFTSTLFAVLAIWLTYILGASVWSRPVGLLAALGFAADYDAVSLASLGWRDDAYVAAVLLGAYLMLRCWRRGREGPRPIRIGRVRVDAAYLEALVFGVAAGFICLVRIMAASFLAGGGVFLLFSMRTAWRRRLAMAGIAALAATIVAAPYFVNCWRVYGDPLYTFNVHGNIYRVAEGQGESSQGTVAYITGKIASRPFQMFDTIAQGLTSYPFTNKWASLDRWRPGLSAMASTAAIAGLVLLASSPAGRLLLVVILTSLIPFSFTWKVDPNWRFTEHVHPFFLIAAAVAASVAFRIAKAVIVPGVHTTRTTDDRDRASLDGRARWIAWAAIGVAGLAGWWLVARVSPSLVFAETLRAREDAMITAGDRDSAFLGRGWAKSVADLGNVHLRVSTGEGRVSFQLPDVDDYTATLRLDPFPRPRADAPSQLPVVEFVLNGASLGSAPLRWSPERVGAYDLALPRAIVHRGNNELIVRLQRSSPNASGSQPGLTDGDAFGLWHIRVHPPVR